MKARGSYFFSGLRQQYTVVGVHYGYQNFMRFHRTAEVNSDFMLKTFMSSMFVSWRIICWWESGRSVMAVFCLCLAFLERAPQTKFQFISIWFQNYCIQWCLCPPKTEAQEEGCCLRILTSAYKAQKLRTWKQKVMRTQALSLIGTWS